MPENALILYTGDAIKNNDLISKINITIKKIIVDLLFKIAALSANADISNIHSRIFLIEKIALPSTIYDMYNMDKIRKFFYIYYNIVVYKNTYDNAIKIIFKGDK